MVRVDGRVAYEAGVLGAGCCPITAHCVLLARADMIVDGQLGLAGTATHIHLRVRTTHTTATHTADVEISRMASRARYRQRGGYNNKQ